MPRQRRVVAGLIALAFIGFFGFIHDKTVGPFFYRILYPIASPLLSISSNQEAGTATREQEELMVIKQKAQLFDDISDTFLLGTSTPRTEAKRIAAIVARPRMSPYGTVIIGAGSLEGVGVGDIALFSEVVAYGEVSRVSSHSSVVIPYSHGGYTFPGLLKGTIDVEIEGRGNGLYEFAIPKGGEVSLGDLLYTDSGFIIAEVENVKETEDSSFINILARSPVSVSAYRFLMVSDKPYSDE